MAELQQLPLPHLDARLFGARRVPALSDELLFRQTGIRIGFTGRAGGVSEPPYDSLNLGSHVQDDPESVRANRKLLLDAFGVPHAPLIVPNQVHGTSGVVVSSADEHAVASAERKAAQGADFLVVEAPGVAALLCFADCAPVVIASPTGRFAVAHAGWRGAVSGIAGKAARALAECDRKELGASAPSEFNAYIGPHIHAECFECGEEVVRQFAEAFGAQAAPDKRHVDLSEALRCDLARAGLRESRILDCGICTMCNPSSYFSYRASGGVCGRHAAVVVRIP